MNSYSTQLCRLCLETTADSLNIFEKFQDADIASILVQHFWFQMYEGDGMSEWVCETCWIQSKTFHNFYKRLESRHKNYLKLMVTKNDEIMQERGVNPMEEELDSKLPSYKCEEETEIKIEETQLLIRNEDSDNDENNDSYNGYDQSDAEEITKDKPSRRKDYSQVQSEKVKQDAEIINFFKMKCDLCSDVDFKTLKEVRSHYRKVHKKRSYLTCCGNRYNSRNLMLEHIEYHRNPDAHRCEQCGKCYKETKSLRIHISSHRSVTHKCNLCPKAYRRITLLNYHVRDKHPANKNEKFTCDHCGKIYSTKTSIKLHIRTCHNPSLHRQVCDICGRSYKTKLDLNRHMDIQHSTIAKVQCDICGTWLKHKNYLKQHFRNHLDSQAAQNGKVFKCPICGRHAHTKSSLYTHIHTTHGDRKHRCTYCDKAFKSPKNLREHIALHTGADLYSCPYCDKTCKSNANMYSHRKKAHLAEWTRDRISNTASGSIRLDRVKSK